MFQIVKSGTNFNFLKYKTFSCIVSIAVVTIAIISLWYHGGPRYGVDFTGGLDIQIKFKQAVDVDHLAEIFAKYKDLPDFKTENYGKTEDHEVLLTATGEHQASEIRAKLTKVLDDNYAGKYEIQQLESVGGKVGADLRSKALEAIFYATLLITVYISGRFEQKWVIAALMGLALVGSMYILEPILHIPALYASLISLFIVVLLCWYLKLSFAMGAVLSILHDLIFVIGLFSILNKPIDLNIVAALLAILGYSLNDTIVIYDRVRENLRKNKAGRPLPEVVNMSVNQTLSRTFLTSGTTLLVLAFLLAMGGNAIYDFSFALFVGIMVGTYSSVFVASFLLLHFTPNVQVEDENAKKVSLVDTV